MTDGIDGLVMAVDDIYGAALQILNERNVDAKAVTLVASTVAQRLEQFAIGAMARELSELRASEGRQAPDEGPSAQPVQEEGE